MVRVLPTATDTERVLACNICGGLEHRPVFRKFGYDLVRCVGCALVFVANPPSPDELRAGRGAAAYPGGQLDPATPAVTAKRRAARQHLRMLRRAVGEQPGLRLFDIGSANGLFLTRAIEFGFDVSGAEPSPQSATFACQGSDLEVHVGDWRDAGHADGTFDVVTLFDVVGHLPDPLGELTAIRRLLRPGGLLLQSAPNLDGLFPRLSYVFAHRFDCCPHPGLSHRRYQFTGCTLAELTERAGYEVTRIDQARVQLGYNFGTPRTWKTHPRLLAYAALFAPAALIGPWLGMGDLLYLSARRPE